MLDERKLRYAVWGFGGLLFALRLWLASRYGSGDFLPVWNSSRLFLHHEVPYGVGDQFSLYPPSSLLIFTPFALVGSRPAVLAFLILDGAAILLAGIICLRLLGKRWQSLLGAGTLVALGLFGPVTQTLYAANVNGLLVLGESAALLALLRRRWLLAGSLLGLACAIKPVLLPLVLVFALWRQWAAIGLSLVIPAALTGLALLLSVDGSLFFTQAVPMLFAGQDQSNENVSLVGAAVAIGLPPQLALIARVVVLPAAVAIGWRLWRSPRAEELRLVELAGLAMVTTFLDFSIAWPYYGIFILPLLVSVVHPESRMRTWVAAIAVYCVGGPDLGLWLKGGPLGFTLLHLRSTLGFLLFLLVLGLPLRRRAPFQSARGAAALRQPQEQSGRG